MKRLAIDIETFSPVPIKYGAYQYAQSPEFRILLFAYQIDDAPVEIVDLTKDELSHDLLAALTDPGVTKTAFNAAFERVCLNRAYHIESGPWACTMIKAWNLGIGGGLDSVSKAMGIQEDAGKIKDGKRLIGLFCRPQKKTKTWNTTGPHTKDDLPEEWERFKTYCKRDVEVERYIADKLSWFTIRPENEQKLYTLDQKINARGVKVDTQMAKNAIQINADLNDAYTKEFQEITGIDRPTRLIPLKEWLSERSGTEIRGVTKKNADELYRSFSRDPEARRALTIRFQSGKTSTAKYQMMIDAAGADDRIRGTLQFYGAGTGRWAGRLIQVQNLPQNHISDLALAREAVKTGDAEGLSLLYANPSDILSQCIRTAIVPEEGKKFVVADYSAIEARVIAYLAGEQWVLDVFRTTGKIYEATASRMLGIPAEDIKKGSPERQKGKVATLALGYQGGVGSLVAMGALKMGIPEEELPGIVSQWRRNNPNIVSLWSEVDNAVKRVVTGDAVDICIRGRMSVYKTHGILFIRLPSGRVLSYPKMRVRPSSRFEGATELCYGAVNQGRWADVYTYGGKLTENIVQATARDCLAHAMLRLEEEGYPIVMHVHDEVVIEVDADDDEALKRVCAIMGEEIPWAPGLPLRADGYECPYYQKD